MTAAQAERDPVERHFAEMAAALDGGPAGLTGGPLRRLAGSAPVRPGSALTGRLCLDLFDAQLASRHVDLAARWLRARGAGFYTIGSSGHEGNAGVAAALRLTDPALLHYRSGAFYLARAQQAVPPRDGVRDMLLGLVAAVEEPIAGGRHKVFGHPQLNVIPQTSTIASHLPRAMGLAFALGRAARLGRPTPWPADAIVLASMGDASVNHSTARGAINTAAYCAYQHLPLPLLLVVEDNGIGISVRTPPGWVAAATEPVPGAGYFHADGSDLAAVYDTALAAAAWVRERRTPAILHLRMVRFGGHAGSDVESGYRSAQDDRRRPGRRPAARHGPAAGGRGPADRPGDHRPVRGIAGPGAGPGRAGGGGTTAGHRRGSAGPPGPAPAGPGVGGRVPGRPQPQQN